MQVGKWIVPLGMVFALMGCQKSDIAVKKQSRLLVAVQRIQPSQEILWVEVPGVTVAPQAVDIRVKTTGYIDRIAFTEGQAVRKGDLLVQLDDRRQKAQLQLAQAKEKQAQTALEQAQRDAKRAKQLYAAKAMSLEEWEKIQSTLQDARHYRQECLATVQQARTELSYTVVRAPADGFMTKALLKEGALVQSNNRIVATLTQKDPLYIEFAPSDRALAGSSLSLDTPVQVLYGTDKRVIEAKLNYISPEQNANNATRAMRARTVKAQSMIPGEFVTVRVAKEVLPTAYRLPQKAVQQLPDGTYQVYLYRDGKAYAQKVDVTQWDHTDWIVRNNGLRPGRLLITNQLIKIRDQMSVKVATQEQKTESKQ